jgi:hypothetical protein
MIKGNELIHFQYLHELVSDLSRVGENRRNIESVIQEPSWTPVGLTSHTLCDVIILYDDFSASALELKGSKGQRHKAIKQIKAGREYIEQVLRYDYRYGLFVVYSVGGYVWERV